MRCCEDNPVPVIVLSGMSDEADRIVRLELGADDYVVSRSRQSW